jgi:aldehyde dehydrogenase (NAD+)
MRDLFVAGGLPDGVLQLVQADGAATFDGLAAALAERTVDKVGFTGSTVGR